MDKIWIVFLFLGVFLIGNNLIKRIIFGKIASDAMENPSEVTFEEKEDLRVFWAEEGLRREPENAEYVLPEEDFFENEKNEFSESFEEEFHGLSDEEKEKILMEAELFEKEGAPV